MRIGGCGCLIAVATALGTTALLCPQSPPAGAAGQLSSRIAPVEPSAGPRSADYQHVQNRLARGWNTWDVHSVATHVLLPDGLAVHVGMKHNSTLNGDAYLGNALIGRLEPGAEQVTPGPHSWDGSYTDLEIAWRGHKWRIQSAHDGADLVLLVAPAASSSGALPPTVVFSVDYLWNRPGTAIRQGNAILAHSVLRDVSIFCTCEIGERTRPAPYLDAPLSGAHFAADLSGPIGVSTGHERSLDEIQSLVDRARTAYQQSIANAGPSASLVDAIQTTLGWDTIYEPGGSRVISPVSRIWSVGWGGYVLFDWDTFFAATMASVGSKDLAYANALEILREETPAGFVPNFARAGEWKSFDRSEPPVGSITVLGLYEKFHDRWFLEDAFDPLLRWNRWWSQHRDIGGYIVLGSDPGNLPGNPDDKSVGTWQGAVYESGLDNSPMYDGTTYDPKSHLLQFADVGMMSLYIADCDALVRIAEALDRPTIAKEVKDRGDQYRAHLAALWDDSSGIYRNKNLRTGEWSPRLSPTNFYPLLARAPTPEQADAMIEKHLLNPREFWAESVLPSIAINDPAFKDQAYWRGRIWGPTNFLVYLGLKNYDFPGVRRDLAARSYKLFLKEWSQNRHVHENYNAVTGSGDDVTSSDRFYHWGALLGYIEYLEQQPAASAQATPK
ncbi:MAG TPA: trehalase family glycosidase [Terracidiphilus sp.]|nr:trehalase family glycosidase [Terracidiphilus sp.]